MKMPSARTLAGGGIFLLTLMVFVMIFLKPELAKDDLFKMLAQAIVVQGLVGLAMAFWFTDKHRDRPDPVEITNPPEHPVPTEDVQS